MQKVGNVEHSIVRKDSNEEQRSSFGERNEADGEPSSGAGINETLEPPNGSGRRENHIAGPEANDDLLLHLGNVFEFDDDKRSVVDMDEHVDNIEAASEAAETDRSAGSSKSRV